MFGRRNIEDGRMNAGTSFDLAGLYVKLELQIKTNTKIKMKMLEIIATQKKEKIIGKERKQMRRKESQYQIFASWWKLMQRDYYAMRRNEKASLEHFKSMLIQAALKARQPSSKNANDKPKLPLFCLVFKCRASSITREGLQNSLLSCSGSHLVSHKIMFQFRAEEALARNTSGSFYSSSI